MTSPDTRSRPRSIAGTVALVLMASGLASHITATAQNQQPIQPSHREDRTIGWCEASKAAAFDLILRHRTTSKLAISDDGNLVAITPAGSHVSDLLVYNVTDKESKLLQLNNRYIRIADSAFSPDGKWIAFVAWRPPYSGASSIVVVEIATGRVVKEIAGPSRAYRNPVFNAEGSALVFFRDTSAQTTTNPEWRELLPWSVFARSMNSETDERLGLQSFLNTSSLIVLNERVLFAGAQRLESNADGSGSLIPSLCAFDASKPIDQCSQNSLFVIERPANAPSERPVDLATHIGRGTFMSVLAEPGDRIRINWRDETAPYEVHSATCDSELANCTQAPWTGQLAPAVSASGKFSIGYNSAGGVVIATGSSLVATISIPDIKQNIDGTIAITGASDECG